MKPSDELLAIRERCVELGVSWLEIHVPTMSNAAYWYLRQQVDGGVREWLATRWLHLLEVVEMIERAAVCALKDEGRI